MNRRGFLSTSAAAGWTAASAQRVLGANDRIGIGTIGTGGRGRTVTRYFKENAKADTRAVCDIYDENLALGAEVAGTNTKTYHEYERLLENKDIDAVLVATPDHWHAPITIAACEAGKDVYVEKPMCHKISEAFEMIEAVRRTKRVVQVGTQRRSYDLFREGKKFMESGRLGKIQLVNSWWYSNVSNPRNPVVNGKVDWERWQGYASKTKEFDPFRFRNWYWFYDYSGGLTVGQGAHILDCINWYMDAKFPSAVTCVGTSSAVAGLEIPQTTSLTVEYPEDFLATFTLGYNHMVYNAAHDQMKQFCGDKGRFDVSRESHRFYEPTRELEQKPAHELVRYGTWGRSTAQHVDNFLSCVQSRKDPNAPVEAGAYVAVALAMAMESLKTGNRMRFDLNQKKMI
ncbi:MAG: Gfo/Idh/MocA family oxidoreductase [Acidobacteria bacterium]|nr:Gfo/Idh/MocA family oxidoreductase [Acidobacteriota bacterium]